MMFLRTTVGSEPGVEVDLTARGADSAVDLQIGRGSRGEAHMLLTAEEARRVAIALRQVADAAEERCQCGPVVPVRNGSEEYVAICLWSDPCAERYLDDGDDDGVDLVFPGEGMCAPLNAEEARQVASVLVQAAEATR